MAYRQKRRTDALKRRTKRVEEGLQADPSNRDRNPRKQFQCTCARTFKRPFQYLLHLNLGSCRPAQ